MSQLALELAARTADRNRAARFRDRVLELLQDGQWHRAKTICAELDGLNERALRQVAEESRGAVISGQHGYKLTRLATNDEIDHAERWLLSQSQAMKARAVDIRKARNSGGVAA